MVAPIGNRFWEARSSHGRKPIFSTPDDLWNAALEYFDWVEKNPLLEEKVFHNSGEIVRANITKPRAMTESGLCIFLDISVSSWKGYKANQGFLTVTTRIREIIRTQKFEGAASDFFNANIIARDLGLAEKREVKQEFGIDDLSKLEAEAKKRGWKRTSD